MTFLPIVDRELRVTSRRPATYWMRFFTALAVIVICVFLTLVTQRSGFPAQRAQMLFMAIGIVAFGFSLLAGVFLTADCLSEEKREGTLGLLFLTDLKGHDVVLGKLAATSIHAFYGVLALLPVLALPLLMGGVTAGEFARVALVLVATLFLSLCTGAFVSAVSQETRQAMTGTFLILLVLTGVLPVLWWLYFVGFRSRPLDVLLWPCPAFTFQNAFDAAYHFGSGARQFWCSMLVMLSLAVAALVSASALLPRVWQERGRGSGVREKMRVWQTMRFGDAAVRHVRRRLLEANPFYWLASRDRLPRLTAFAILGPLILIWLCFLAGCLVRTNAKHAAFTVVMFLGYGLHQVLKCLIAIEASRRLSDDRRTGALELLLVTPITEKEILAGQRRALNGFFLGGPLGLALLVNAGLLWLLTGPNPMGMNGDDARMFGEMCVGGALLTFLDYYALSWVGMRMGLRAPRHPRAIAGTLARVMLIPWLAILFMVFMGIGRVNFSQGDIEALTLIWFGLGIANDLIVGMRARNFLPGEFRQVSGTGDAGIAQRPTDETPTAPDFAKP